MGFFKKLILSGRKKQKGIAMIATLFTVAIVLILGVSFLMMAFKDSVNTRSEKESVFALQMAHTGAELLMNYMSVRDNWEYASQKEFNVVLKAYPTGGQPNSFKSSQINGETFNFYINRDAYNGSYYHYTITISPDRTLGTGSAYTGKTEIDLIQAIFKSGQPPQFVATSTGTIFKTGSTKMVAARQVEVRFREKSALDNLLFVQNMRAWDLVGNGVAPPNANDGSNDSVGIPANYTANGSVVIDGNSEYATETSGNLRFFNPNSGNVHFYGQTSISQQQNYDSSGNAINSDANGKIFQGGLMTGQTSVGLPEKNNFMSVDYNGNGSIATSEQGTAVTLAKDYSGTNSSGSAYNKSYFRCGDNDGITGRSTNEIGHSKATKPERWVGEYGMPNTAANISAMSQDAPSDVEFDGLMLNSKPGFAKFTVEFGAAGTVTVKKTTAYTKKSYTLLNNVSVDTIKNGILYFEGGNVEVKNAQNNGGFKGQLTIVSAEDSVREATSYSITTANGKTITQYSTEERNRSVYPNNPELWTPGKVSNQQISSVVQQYSSGAGSIYVPFNSSALPVRVDPTTGNLSGSFDRVPPYYVGGKWVWPGESTIKNTIKNVAKEGGGYISVFNDIEREGNVTIGGNLTYAGGGNNALGIIAKNYILLNSDDVSVNSPELTVNAVLMSFDHSVQFDDVNMSGKDSWISQPGMNGKFNFTGSNISQFADVEGKIDGTGYTNQSLTYDQNLKTTLPPNFPRWDFMKMSADAVIEYVVLNYQDKGASKIFERN
ncbi:MAG: hypothetical protein LWY06_20810 [Firmicutes bacterium]|nr:hypothetical protein [Bacillota bacterium]